MYFKNVLKYSRKIGIEFSSFNCKILFLFQLLSSIVVVGGTNVAGALTHHPRELAQRQAFLETRQCVEARLTTQRENQQQVRCCIHEKFIRRLRLTYGST